VFIVQACYVLYVRQRRLRDGVYDGLRYGTTFRLS
jgi:hypothetical protein